MATALDTGSGFTGATEGSSSYDSTFSLYASGSFTSFTGSTSVTQQTFLFNDGIVQSNYIFNNIMRMMYIVYAMQIDSVHIAIDIVIL